jgi:hypothetical protein
VATIHAEDMLDKLLPLDKVREALASTEPIAPVGFGIGEDVRFRLEGDWNHDMDQKDGTSPVNAFVTIGRGPAGIEYQLTKDSVLEATSLCGIPKGYAQRTPGTLIEPQLDYWFQGGLGDKSFKLLSVGDNVGAAFTRATIQPFSNLRLLDETLSAIEGKYGTGEVYADYKFTHSLRKTHLRLIVPEQMRTIQDTGRDGDNWSVGIQLKNSLIGEEQTSLEGYLFAWWCTNGAIDTAATSGTWSRRGGGQGDDVYEWARASVDEVLGGLEHSLDKVQDMVNQPVEGEATDVLRDIFSRYRVPAAQRQAIIENMVEATSLNMYSIMQAITAAANSSGVEASAVEQLMRVGGELPHTAHDRCESCHRIQVH